MEILDERTNLRHNVKLSRKTYRPAVLFQKLDQRLLLLINA